MKNKIKECYWDSKTYYKPHNLKIGGKQYLTMNTFNEG